MQGNNGSAQVPWLSAETRFALLRAGAGALLASGVVLAHLPSSVGIPCPLYVATGIPCPFCGLTTSVRSIMGARVGAAAAANPVGFLVVVACVALLLAPFQRLRAILGAVPRRLVWTSVGFLVVGSWIFELARFGFL
jgi:hypothetical protein